MMLTTDIADEVNVRQGPATPGPRKREEEKKETFDGLAMVCFFYYSLRQHHKF